MENTMNINIEETVDQAMEVITETTKVNWKKFGVGALVVGAVAAAGYGIYRFATSKKAKEEAEPEYLIDNVEVAKNDFLEEESEEE